MEIWKICTGSMIFKIFIYMIMKLITLKYRQYQPDIGEFHESIFRDI